MYVHICQYIPCIFIHLNYHAFTYSVDLVQDGAAGNTEVDFGQKHISLQLIILSYESSVQLEILCLGKENDKGILPR